MRVCARCTLWQCLTPSPETCPQLPSPTPVASTTSLSSAYPHETLPSPTRCVLDTLIVFCITIRFCFDSTVNFKLFYFNLRGIEFFSYYINHSLIFFTTKYVKKISVFTCFSSFRIVHKQFLKVTDHLSLHVFSYNSICLSTYQLLQSPFHDRIS